MYTTDRTMYPTLSDFESDEQAEAFIAKHAVECLHCGAEQGDHSQECLVDAVIEELRDYRAALRRAEQRDDTPAAMRQRFELRSRSIRARFGVLAVLLVFACVACGDTSDELHAARERKAETAEALAAL